MARPRRLDDTEIAARVAPLNGWEYAGGALRKVFVFNGFPEAAGFVQRLVDPAEALNHHPDLTINYNRVGVSLSTHDQGGVTDLDFQLLTAIEAAITNE
ncbi:MAG: 4a-hydroxytetrahydrobiopterin dehydratase [Dehalococcoidia bacterium]|nr:4a-hydroxytetrahydrobiopterin dehydratase [Dehalococcoidia bacterium]